MPNTKTHLDNLVLITGGAKSGKSTLAEELASMTNSNVLYLATMPKLEGDSELAYKIREHQSRRPDDWQTIEKDLSIEVEIDKFDSNESTCIIDCLSTYVSNLMHKEGFERDYAFLKNKLEECLDKLTTAIKKKNNVNFIVVTNEVGLSVIPENKSARTYRELLGLANQTMAKAANQVYFCCSGIKMKIKSDGKTVLS